MTLQVHLNGGKLVLQVQFNHCPIRPIQKARHCVSMRYWAFVCFSGLHLTTSDIPTGANEKAIGPPPPRATSLCKQTVKVDCKALSELLTIIAGQVFHFLTFMASNVTMSTVF